MRRWWFLALVLCVGLRSVPAVPVWGQDADRDAPSLRLTVVDREVLQALDEARRLTAKKQFHPVVQLLQSVLDHPEDFFVEEDFRRNDRNTDETRGGRGGVKTEALRLLKALPAEGHAVYELEYGATARDELEESQAEHDLDRVAGIARRFSLTMAGFDATVLLAAHASDAGRPLEAALLLETLKDHPAAAQKRTPQFLLNVAACWSRTGRTDRSLAALREMKSLTSGKTLRVGGRDVALFARDEQALAWLNSLLGPIARPSAAIVDTWTMPGGGPTRNESAVPASPVGGELWRVSLFEHLTIDGRSDVNHQRRTQLEDILQREERQLRDENRLALPAAQPIVIGDTVVYRTIGDVSAVSLRTGELLWRSAMTDNTLVRLWNNRNIETRAGEVRDVNLAVASSLGSHLRRRLFRDVAAGTLSSDGQTVFALEELDASVTSQLTARAFAESAISNKLAAYDLAGGRMLWEVGGPRGAKPTELSGHFFLGPPLPLDGRLYCLAEKQGELRLLVLAQEADRSAVRLDWSQTVIATDRPVTARPMRRLAGLTPSFADGILLCPTSSGAVVAVDAIRRVLLWGYQYRSTVLADPQDARMAMFQRISPQTMQMEDADETSRWLDGSPVVVEGRMLVTPRDADELHCLDLLDGRVLWKLPRGDWLYGACVVDGRVVMVGREGLAAFQLDDGKPVESFIGCSVEPAGRGVRVGSLYYLPLKTGEIATVELRTGTVLARSKLAEGRVPGNLIAGGGAIVSQSAGGLIGFARLDDIERRIGDDLKVDPRQPAALALRGELRLHRGEEAAGLADLRESLKRIPDSRVKSVLAASLLSGVRANPKLIHERAAELETLTDDPQQRNEFLRLYAKSLEEAGDRRGAFAQMIRLAETARFLSDLESFTASHAVRTDRAIRARLIEMYAATSPEERMALDQALVTHVEAAQEGQDSVEYLDRCLRFFAGLPRVELLLFEQVTSSPNDTPARIAQRQKLLERFAQSTDLTLAAKATALLTRELLEADQPREALPLLNRLRDEFAERDCLDGQTGRSLAETWLARDDIKHLLNVPPVWPAGPIDVNRLNTPQAVAQRTSLAAEVVSVQGPDFVGWSFETDPTGSILMARDATGKHRWRLAIPADATFNDNAGRNLSGPYQLHAHDHWLALSLGTHFVVMDARSPTETPRPVWQQTLRISGMSANDAVFAQRGIQVLPNGRVVRLGNPASGRILGQFVGLTRETAIYIVGSRLCAAELDTGRLAWSRHDVLASRADVTADDRVVTLLPNATRELRLLRTLDGSDVAKRKLEADETWLWLRGARQLIVKQQSTERLFELRDLERGVVVWNRTHPLGSQTTVIDDEDVAILEPSGHLAMVQLAEGRVRYEADLPLKSPERGIGWFAVQRMDDRDVILGGGASKVPNTTRIDASNPNAFPFDGHVCGVSRADGKLLWTTEVEQMSFDRSQPSRLPVLLLSMRLFDQAGNAANPFANRYRLRASLIDKRTGRQFYSIEQNAPAAPPRLEPDPDHRRVIANFHDWQLELTFPEPKPDAR